MDEWIWKLCEIVAGTHLVPIVLFYYYSVFGYMCSFQFQFDSFQITLCDPNHITPTSVNHWATTIATMSTTKNKKQRLQQQQ